MGLGSVLISGAGIAGPAAALWLSRLGASVTVVERAPALREGGQAVDFRGDAHLDVLRRMALLERVRERCTRPLGLAVLRTDGRASGKLPASFMGGAVEITRGDLVRVLYEATRDAVEYRFGEAISSLRDDGTGVDVEFERGAPERFDLVLGADGLRSRTREIAFRAEEARCVRHLGCYAALWSLPDAFGLRDEAVLYSTPGRGVLVTPDERGTANALFVFRSAPRDELRHDAAAQRDAVLHAYASAGWRVPQMLEAVRTSGRALYFDAIACVELERYSCGRVALLGDAAWGGTLGGQGTGLAIVGAYVLAGALAASGGGDPGAALARYERTMRPYATRCQQGARNAGGFFAPTSAVGLALRNAFYRVMASKPMLGMLERLTTSAARDVEFERWDDRAS